MNILQCYFPPSSFGPVSVLAWYKNIQKGSFIIWGCGGVVCCSLGGCVLVVSTCSSPCSVVSVAASRLNCAVSCSSAPMQPTGLSCMLLGQQHAASVQLAGMILIQVHLIWPDTRSVLPVEPSSCMQCQPRLMMSQWWCRWWLGADRQQAVTCTIVDHIRAYRVGMILIQWSWYNKLPIHFHQAFPGWISIEDNNDWMNIYLIWPCGAGNIMKTLGLYHSFWWPDDMHCQVTCSHDHDVDGINRVCFYLSMIFSYSRLN